MFVAIDNKDMDFLKVDAWINESRDNTGGKVISPELAMDVLSKTNHFANIKKVLTNIKKNSTTKEQLEPYKEFILSCVDGREMSDVAMASLREMAKVLGEDFEKEFDDANKNPKVYDKYECDRIVVKSEEELKALEGENLRVLFDAETISLRKCDLSKIESLKFRRMSHVFLTEIENLPKDLDLSRCYEATISDCDLEEVNIKLQNTYKISFISVNNLPKDLNVSKCADVTFYRCDLEGLNLDFIYSVNLNGSKNLPKDLDFSKCSQIRLYGCDLEGLDLKFKEGAEVGLCNAYNIPKDLDVSMCSDVDLEGCDLEGLDLRFKEGAIVNFTDAENLPKDLDVSMCDRVDLSYCDLAGVLKIRFKDKEQESKFMKAAKNFEGKVVYVGENGDCESEKVEQVEKVKQIGFGAKLKKIFDKGME